MTIDPITSSNTVQRYPTKAASPVGVASAVATATSGALTANGLVPQSTIDSIAGINVEQQKSSLFDSAAGALGVSATSYSSQADYGDALAAKIKQMQGDASGQALLASISKNLGLDDLGISLSVIASAIESPGGSDDQSVDRSIRGKSSVEQVYFAASARYLAGESDGTYSSSGVVAKE